MFPSGNQPRARGPDSPEPNDEADLGDVAEGSDDAIELPSSLDDPPDVEAAHGLPDDDPALPDDDPSSA
jgi:hypothetical protein